MLACERWTLTHSSGGAVVPLPLPLAVGLGSELGLVLTSAASVALVVVVAVVLAVAVPVALADEDSVWSVPLADGSTLGGSLAVAEWPAAGLLELADGDGDGDGEGDGDGDFEGDGEGAGVPGAGRAWHTVSVLLLVTAGAACTLPTAPRVRMLPLSKVTAAALTCAKRIWDRLSTLLVRVTVCSALFLFGRD
jgi:hypothetical protein